MLMMSATGIVYHRDQPISGTTSTIGIGTRQYQWKLTICKVRTEGSLSDATIVIKSVTWRATALGRIYDPNPKGRTRSTGGQRDCIILMLTMLTWSQKTCRGDSRLYPSSTTYECQSIFEQILIKLK